MVFTATRDGVAAGDHASENPIQMSIAPGTTLSELLERRSPVGMMGPEVPWMAVADGCAVAVCTGEFGVWLLVDDYRLTRRRHMDHLDFKYLPGVDPRWLYDQLAAGAAPERNELQSEYQEVLSAAGWRAERRAHAGKMIEYLADQRPDTARFADQLLEDGNPIVEVIGPVQMGVWHLVIQCGHWQVAFHCERGMVERARIKKSDATRPTWHDDVDVSLAILAWARATGSPYRLDLFDRFDYRARLHADLGLVEYGRQTVAWLNQGNEEAFARVVAVWRDYIHACGQTARDARAALAEDTLRRMEGAATPR